MAINLKDLTLVQLDELQSLLGIVPTESTKAHPYTIGKPYFVRTVTHHFTGVLVEVFDQELVFDSAA